MTQHDSLIRFIALFGYTTPQILFHLFRQKKNSRRHYLVISHAKKNGFVQTVQHGIFSENLIFLTSEGIYYAMAKGFHVPDGKIKSPHNFSAQHLMHDLCTQMFVAKRINAEDLGAVNAQFVQAKSKQKVPDLIINQEVAGLQPPVAIEIEITKKSKVRIYDAFHNHVQSIRKNPSMYQSVLYLFPDTSKQKHYSKLFLDEDWPVTEKKDRSIKFVKRGLSKDFLRVKRQDIPETKNFKFASFKFHYNFRLTGERRGRH